jgi:hypothetical protein
MKTEGQYVFMTVLPVEKGKILCVFLTLRNLVELFAVS